MEKWTRYSNEDRLLVIPIEKSWIATAKTSTCAVLLGELDGEHIVGTGLVASTVLSVQEREQVALSLAAQHVAQQAKCEDAIYTTGSVVCIRCAGGL